MVTDVVGGTSPVEARTDGLVARRASVRSGGRLDLELGSDRIAVVHIIDGPVTINTTTAGVDDTLTLRDIDRLTVTADAGPGEVFVITIPATPAYEPRRFDIGRRRPGAHRGSLSTAKWVSGRLENSRSPSAQKLADRGSAG